MNFLKKREKVTIIVLSLIVIISSFILGFHNATFYDLRHGFDGIDHLSYIKYLGKYWHLPPPKSFPEAHQSPLYYFIGALLMHLTGTWKTAQYVNIFVLWGIISMTGAGLWKIFKKAGPVLIGMLSLASLPMLNIFSAMLTNELLNTFWIVSGLIACLFIIKTKTKTEFIKYMIWLSFNLILGYWTKVSIIFIIPIVIFTLLIKFLSQKNRRFLILFSTITFFLIIIILSAPIYMRGRSANVGDPVRYALTKTKYVPKPIEYYFRLDWIYKIDMYNTQYYSLIGAAWNSFWTDGHNAITPFVKFHKKSFILWTLGFFLLPICLYGLFKKMQKEKNISLVLKSTGLLMLIIYSFANFTLYGHYSSARLTYEMGIIVPYSFGIAAASENKKFRFLLIILLSIQFITMISFLWIQPWWHVTK